MKDGGSKGCRRIDVLKSLHGIVDSYFATLIIGGLSLEFHEDPSGEVLLILSNLLLRENAVQESL